MKQRSRPLIGSTIARLLNSVPTIDRLPIHPRGKASHGSLQIVCASNPSLPTLLSRYSPARIVTAIKEFLRPFSSAAALPKFPLSHHTRSMKVISLQFEDCAESNLVNFLLLADKSLTFDFLPLSVNLSLRHCATTKATLRSQGTVSVTPSQLESLKRVNHIIFGHPKSQPLPPCQLYYLVPIPRSLGSQPDASLSKTTLSQILDDPSMPRGKISFADVASSQIGQILASAEFNVSSSRLSEEPSGKLLHMGNGAYLEGDVADSLVFVRHTNLVYVARQVSGLTAGSQFPEKECSFQDYFLDKYGIVLQFPDQPLLNLRRLPKVANMLDHKTEVAVSSTSQKSTVGELLPAELCHVIPGITAATWRSAIRLPSILHRLETLLLAHHLKLTIGGGVQLIPTLDILTALTAGGSAEGFSYELYEILGDSYLKYAVARHWFLADTSAKEGALSARLSERVSNRHLYDLAKAVGLPGYISSVPFDPASWQPPLEASSRDFLAGKRAIRSAQIPSKKMIADAVEALIGLLVSQEGGEKLPLQLFHFLGMQEGGGRIWTEMASRLSLAPNPLPHLPGWLSCKFQNVLGNRGQLAEMPQDEIRKIEQKIGYEFQKKWLLERAFWHPSTVGYVADVASFERLEFLGDAVLDHLVTRHMVESNPGLDPGGITDLKQAATNNQKYALTAVVHSLHLHLRMTGAPLARRMSAYATAVRDCAGEDRENDFGGVSDTAPKVLADLVEAIAGAVLLDSGLNLETVWKVMKPLLSPLPEADSVGIHPVRRLLEVCQQLNLDHQIKSDAVTDGLFEVRILVDGQLAAYVRNENLQTARRLASLAALQNLSSDGRLMAEVNVQSADLVQSADRAQSEEVLPERELAFMLGRHGKRMLLRDGNDCLPAVESMEVPNTSSVAVAQRMEEEEASRKVPSRSILNNLCASKGWQPVEYELVGKIGPDHFPSFRFRARVATPNRKVEIEGLDMPSHAKAKEDAASRLLRKLRRESSGS